MLTLLFVISFRRLELFKALFFAMIILTRRLELQKETRQAAVSRFWLRAWTDNKPLNFAAPTSDRRDMPLYPRVCSARSFQNVPRNAILNLQEQLSQHDRCKLLDQWHLKYAVSWSQLTNRLPHGVFKTPFTISLTACSSLNFPNIF